MSGSEPCASGLYDGAVTHRRLTPRKHALRYRMFWLLLDLDELEGLAARLRWFSEGRLNLFSFEARDHLEGSDQPLRRQVEAHLWRAGIDLGGGPIRVLCVPRILGYAFNPLSVWFCHRRDGSIAAMIYEVNNTIGQRHSYLIPVEAGRVGAIEQSCEKRFYVSPFMDMGLTYDFRIEAPGEAVAVGVNARNEAGLVIATRFAGNRRELTDVVLVKAFLSHPFLALKIVAGIHWEALRIWLKGVPFRSPPASPARAVTIDRR